VRINVFTSIVVGLGAVAYLFWQRGRPREVIDRGPKSAKKNGARTPDAPTEPGLTVAAPDDDAAAVRAREDDHRPADPG
jgi:hypothetical protein